MIGTLPAEIIAKGKEYCGDFGRMELRLLPYLYDCAINGKVLDARKMDIDELILCGDFASKKLLGLLDKPVKFIDKKFWDFVCDCLFHAYNGQ